MIISLITLNTSHSLPLTSSRSSSRSELIAHISFKRGLEVRRAEVASYTAGRLQTMMSAAPPGSQQTALQPCTPATHDPNANEENSSMQSQLQRPGGRTVRASDGRLTRLGLVKVVIDLLPVHHIPPGGDVSWPRCVVPADSCSRHEFPGAILVWFRMVYACFTFPGSCEPTATFCLTTAGRQNNCVYTTSQSWQVYAGPQADCKAHLR